jgi:hypothetical protein
VPISLKDMMRDGLGRSLTVGMLIFGVLFPIKWLFPAGIVGTLAIATIALVTLVFAGLAFIVNVDERTALMAVARRRRT